MELKRILDILLRRRWIVLSIFSVVMVSTILGTLFITTWYDTTAMIFMQKSAAASSLLVNIGLQAQSMSTALSDTDRSDYVELAQMRPVIERALKKQPVKRQRITAKLIKAVPFLQSILALAGVKAFESEEPMTAEKLTQWSITRYFFPRPYVKIEQLEDTDIIKIKAISTSPEESMKISNAIADSFIEEELSRIRRDYQGAKDVIEATISASQIEYVKSMNQLRDFKEHEKTINIDAETTAIISKLYDYKKSMEDNTVALYKTKAMIAKAQSKLKDIPKYQILSEELKSNEMILNLKVSLRDLYFGLAETKTNYTSTHPSVVDIENKIQKTKEMIQNEVQKIFSAETKGIDLVYQDIETKLSGYYADLAGYESQKETYPKVVAIYEREMLGFPKKAFEYSQVQLQADVTQEVYRSLLKCKYQVGLAEAIALSNLYVVEYAITPKPDDSKHKHPSLLLNFVVALFFGGFLGIQMGLLFEHIDDTVKTGDDIKQLKGLRFLGNVFKTGKKNEKLIISIDPKSPLREAFRTIRNNIKFASVDKKLRSIVITSSIQGEGKSFFASNIAIAMSMEGKKVIVVDGDMRRHYLHHYFDLDNGIGLSDYLTGEADLNSFQRDTHINGVHLITTGTIPSDPANLVDSEKMKQMISTLMESYDIVIVDSPPILAANDAIVLGGLADGLILVLETGRVARKDFEESYLQLQNANLNVIGVVLNKVNPNTSYYCKYHSAFSDDGKRGLEAPSTSASTGL